MGSANDEFDRLWARSGWKQARVARELGISSATVSRYVSREIEPSRPVLLRLSDLLNIPLLLDDAEYRPNSLRDGARWLTDWEANVITILRRLESDTRDRVIRGIAEIVDAIAHPPRYKVPRKTKAKDEVDPLPSTEQLIHAAIKAVTLPQGSSPLSSAVAPPEEDPPRLDVSAESPPSSRRRRARKPGSSTS